MTDSSECRYCGEPFSSSLGAGTEAGRFCAACGQYEGFPDANVGPRLPYACPQCGQLSDVQGHCDACRDLARAPQGEAVRLFTPAPAQLPGQLNL